MAQASFSDKREYFFDEPRLRMTLGGRLLVRTMGIVSLALLAIFAATAFASGMPQLWAIALLIFIFLADWLGRRGEAQRHLNEMPEEGRVNLAHYICPHSYVALEHAYDRALIKKTNIFLEMALYLTRKSDQIGLGLDRLDIKKEEFRHKIEELLLNDEECRSDTRETIYARVELIIRHAVSKAPENKERFVEVTDIFAGLADIDNNGIHRLFTTFSLDSEDVMQAMSFSAAVRQFGRRFRLPEVLNAIILGGEKRRRHRIMNRAWTSRPTYHLDAVGRDLTDEAREGNVGFLIGHKEEYQRLVETLARVGKPNALLVGEMGTGKTTIIEHLAAQLVKDRVPPPLFDKRLVQLSIADMVAGAPPEEVQQRVANIVEDIITAGNVILHIPDIHNLVHTSGQAYLSAADALIPIIENDSFPVVGSTYPREFKQMIEPRSDFASAFEVIHVNELSERDAQRVLTYEAVLLEGKHKINISFGAVKMAVQLAKRHFRQKMLPASAEDLLKSAVTHVLEKGEKRVGPEQVIAVAEQKVNIPIHAAGEEEARQLLNLEETIHKRLIGQKEAVKAVADALREYRSGLARPGGPIASFLFVGPTGVGKTELSKILAQIHFGSKEAMVRFDMTEYQDKQSFYRFIGSPDGSVTGTLTDAILKKPYALVLLDEFEKSYPDILNLFLQVLDDGQLTDNLGRTVDFSNTIVIATSNAHSDIINEAMRAGQTMAQIGEYLKSRLTDVFKPELLNRFSKIIVFHDLKPDEVRKVAEINLKGLAESVEDQGIFLIFDESAIDQISHLGYDPAFGARPLRRVIEEKVRAVLAQAILSRQVQKGSTVKLVYRDDKFEFVSD
ncbi:MAG: ATP-dependent Clp protease ATP-binding subunit [Candidatus Liptonbacteria bacterium]